MSSEVFEFLAQAKENIKNKNLEDFIRNISLAEFLAKGNQKLHQEVLLEQINGLYKLGSYTEIINHISRMLECNTLDYNTKTELLRKKGIVLGRLGKYDEAQKIFEGFLNENFQRVKVLGYGNLVWVLLYKYKKCNDENLLNRAEQLCKKGVKIAKELNDKSLYKDLLINMGNIYWERQNYHDALDSFKQVYFEYQNPTILNNLAATYVSLGMEKEARSFVEKAMLQANKEHNKFEIGYSNLILGRIEEEINEDYMKAKDYCLVAFDSFIVANAFYEACECFDKILRLSEIINRESVNFMAKKFKSQLLQIFEDRISDHS